MAVKPLDKTTVLQNTLPESAAQKDAQLALTESRYMLDQVQDCIFMFRADDLRFTYVNEGTKRQLGYTEAELLELTPVDIKPGFTVERYRRLIQPLLDGTQPTLTFETIHRHKDGHDMPVAISVQRACLGKELRFVAIAHPIVRRQNDKLLRERLKEITCLYSIRHDMGLELPLAETCQRISQRLIMAMQFPETTAVVIEFDGKQFTSAKYSPDLVHGLHVQIAVNGKVCGQLQVFYCEDRPFLLPEEQNLINAVAVDLQWWLERKQTAAALESSLEQVKLIQNALDAHAIVAITDRRGKIIYVNDKFCAISQYALAELLGQDHRVVNSGHHSQAFFRELWQTISNGLIWKGEIKNRAKDGTFYWVATTIVPFLDEHGKPAQYIAVRTDITKRKQTEQALISAKDEAEKANHTKDSFLATMSHEIRTPLGGMLGMLELLSYTPLNNDQRETLQVAQDSGRNLLRILNDILDWSKIEAGKLELAPQATSISQLVAGVVNTYARMASSNSVILAQHIDARLSPALMLDPLRLSQVLNNFVSNALKFTPQGQVEVRAELLGRCDDNEQVRFSVKDTGIGIAKDLQQRLFQNYSQHSSDTARMYGGTGLGLAISRRLANLLDGSIDLESAPGQGSTFSLTLTLPIATTLAESAPRLHAAMDTASAPTFITGGAQAGTLAVLVVDDHPTNRKLLVSQLRLLGLPSETAENGEAALALWLDGGFSLIITDCHMPQMDGYQLTQAIRQIEAHEARPHIPVLGWTANALPEEMGHCHAAGMDALLVKPVDLAQLKVALTKWLPAAALVAVGTDDAGHEAAGNAQAPIDPAKLAEFSVNAADKIAILQDFMAQTRSDFSELAAVLKQQDFPACVWVAHRMKGASRMVGAHELAAVCETLEHAARQSNGQGADAAQAALDSALARLEVYLAEEIDANRKENDPG